MNLTNIINHARKRTYMGGVQRTKKRVKASGEIFTPTPVVREILGKLDQTLFKDPTKTFLDNACGDGQFLSEILIKKFKYSNQTDDDFKQALSTIYGVDINADNILLCRERLLCGREEFRSIVEENILIGNSLDPEAAVPGQTTKDHERMKELFYVSPEEKKLEKEILKTKKITDELVETGLFELQT
jgi:type I restriction-modification system DNA methylase subunit